MKLVKSTSGAFKLPPECFIELQKRKGITCYFYHLENPFGKNPIFKLKSSKKDFIKTQRYSWGIYSTKNIGETVLDADKFKGFVLHVDYYDRCDPDLIYVVENEMKNDEWVEIINVPDGMKYEIIEDSLGNEIIVEKGHFW